MRTNITRWVLAVSMMVALSGCYSNGQWSAPNLAFWRSSPFQSSQGATPTAPGSPVKPSGIASGNRSTLPTGGYAANTPGTVAPSWTPPNATANYNASNATAPYAGQYPTQYPSTSSGVATTPNYSATAYTASNAGVPGANAYGTPTSNSTAQPSLRNRRVCGRLRSVQLQLRRPTPATPHPTPVTPRPIPVTRPPTPAIPHQGPPPRLPPAMHRPVHRRAAIPRRPPIPPRRTPLPRPINTATPRRRRAPVQPPAARAAVTALQPALTTTRAPATTPPQPCRTHRACRQPTPHHPPTIPTQPPTAAVSLPRQTTAMPRRPRAPPQPAATVTRRRCPATPRPMRSAADRAIPLRRPLPTQHRARAAIRHRRAAPPTRLPIDPAPLATIVLQALRQARQPPLPAQQHPTLLRPHPRLPAAATAIDQQLCPANRQLRPARWQLRPANEQLRAAHRQLQLHPSDQQLLSVGKVIADLSGSMRPAVSARISSQPAAKGHSSCPSRALSTLENPTTVKSAAYRL